MQQQNEVKAKLYEVKVVPLDGIPVHETTVELQNSVISLSFPLRRRLSYTVFAKGCNQLYEVKSLEEISKYKDNSLVFMGDQM